MNIYGRKGCPPPKALKKSQIELEELGNHLREAFDRCRSFDMHRDFILQLEQQVIEYTEAQE